MVADGVRAELPKLDASRRAVGMLDHPPARYMEACFYQGGEEMTPVTMATATDVVQKATEDNTSYALRSKVTVVD